MTKLSIDRDLFARAYGIPEGLNDRLFIAKAMPLLGALDAKAERKGFLVQWEGDKITITSDSGEFLFNVGAIVTDYVANNMN